MNILVIPDIHGRTFWKDVCLNNDIKQYDKIIFLGDYVDPYPAEGINKDKAIENFKYIIDFANNNKDKVILLLGNHDMHYCSNIFLNRCGGSRLDHINYNKLKKIFNDNFDLFHIVYITDNTIFSHAGIHKDWLKLHNLKLTQESLDNLKVNSEPLTDVSNARGGYNKYGSCVWSDISEYEVKSKNGIEYINDFDKYQIFGHTLQLDIDEYLKRKWVFGHPIFSKHLSMLDSGQAYEYNETNKTIKSANDKLKTTYSFTFC